MRYIKDTFYYLFIRGKGKYFLFIFLAALLPSVALGYGLPSEIFLVNAITPPSYQNFGELWLSFFQSPYCYIGIILGILCFIPTTAMVIGITLRHFRVGNFSLKEIPHSINDYSLPSILYSSLLLVLGLVAFTIYTAFAYMWYAFCIPVAYSVLSILTLLILYTIFLYVVSSLTLWLPSMCIMGLYSGTAISKCFYQSRSKQKYFFPGHLFSALIVLLTMIISYFCSKIWYISWIINSIGYDLAFTFSVIFILTTYFAEKHIPREDIGVSPYKRRD